MDPSYRFPIFETSAAALCGNISTYCIRVSGRSCAIMPVILTEDIAPWIPEGVGVEPNPKKAHQDTSRHLVWDFLPPLSPGKARARKW